MACEYSGTVREAYCRRGIDAWSCDLLETEIPGNHIVGDVRDVLDQGWDLMIGHPPCTHLSVSGAKFFERKRASGEQQEAMDFFMALWNAPIPKIALENPVSVVSTLFRQPDCIVHPYQFGHGETKTTCFWLKGLKPLIPTHLKDDLFAAQQPVERSNRIHFMSPSPDRWKERSRTYAGIAEAIADQWQ